MSNACSGEEHLGGAKARVDSMSSRSIKGFHIAGSLTPDAFKMSRLGNGAPELADVVSIRDRVHDDQGMRST